MVKISVIVPVYNTEKYLRKCLDSIVNQTLEDIEIICVNDGSTDNSLDILNEFNSKDNRIKIITQDNQGLGAARNNGLKHAGGEYVYFIDSDDYIDLTALEKLYNNAESNGSDLVLFKFQTFDDNENVHTRGVEFKIDDIFGDIDYNNFTFTYPDAKRHVMNSAFSACLKLYKREFIDTVDDFHFEENLSFEDIPPHVKVMLSASKISFVPENLYYYRSNPDSILNSQASGFDMLEIICIVEDYLRKNSFYEEFENEFIFFKIAQILKYMISTKSDEYFEIAKDEFSKISIDSFTLPEYASKGYDFVMTSQNLDEYIDKYYDDRILPLMDENSRLIEENKRLRKLNRELLSSNSWKITKPLRSLMNFKK